jgi:hypothetical protein
MSKIVAGRFKNTVDAEAALASLQREGFRSGEYESFYVAPPGQNSEFPIGGDEHADRGARKASWGAVAGAALGAIVGAAGGAALGNVASGEFGLITTLLGAGLGAYVGSFAGSMSKMRDGGASAKPAGVQQLEHGGRMVAINVDRAEMERRAIDILHRHGARDVGRAEGTWRDGSWRDFDPRRPFSAA